MLIVAEKGIAKLIQPLAKDFFVNAIQNLMEKIAKKVGIIF